MNDKREMNMTLIAVVASLGTSLGVASEDLKAAAEVMQHNTVPHAVQMKEMPPATQYKFREMPPAVQYKEMPHAVQMKEMPHAIQMKEIQRK